MGLGRPGYPVVGTNALITCGHGNGRGVQWEVIGYHNACPYHFPFQRYFMQPVLVGIQSLVNAPELESLMSTIYGNLTTTCVILYIKL